jgi:predicted esterase
MKKAFMVILIFVTAFVMVRGQDKKDMPFSTFPQMRAHIGKLYEQKRYAEAAVILEKALTFFPDHLLANTYNLAFMFVQLEEYERALKALEYGLDNGIWFNKYAFLNDMWNPLKETDGYEAFAERNEAKRQEAQKGVKPKLEVLVPEGYDKSKKYPLFIALHGGSENIDVFKPQWTSNMLKDEFILVYPQSGQIVSMDGYSWTEDTEQAKKEIRQAYDKVIRDYSVDTFQVIIGGFSSGGVASLEVVLGNTIPVIGFVVLCPARPNDFTAEKIAEAQKRGIRGTLLTTEMDPRLPDQKKMAEIMKTMELPHEFIITPNTGHWYPEGLDKKIDAAISHIRNRD